MMECLIFGIFEWVTLLHKSDYIDIDKDTAEFSNEFSTTEEKIKSGLTIGAKVVGNIGIGTVNIGVSFLKALPSLMNDHANRLEEKNKKN